MSTVAAATAARPRLAWRRLVSRHGWTVGVWLLFLAMLPYWRSLSSQAAAFDIESLAIDVLPLALAAMAQSIVIISGGIDLSVGSLMSLINVLSAKYMVHMSYREAVLYALALILAGAAAGAFTGSLITVSRVPDIVVTLAMLFVWAGLALQILEIPGGGAPQKFIQLGIGTSFSKYLPTSAVILAVLVLLVWSPIRWTKPGLAIYAVGSNRNAAYLAGIRVATTRVGAYALGGAFAAMGGLALTATSGIGDPNSGAIYTLNSVAAAVLGGVSLLGGVGGLVGPIAAAGILTLVKTILILRGENPNYAQVYQGAIIIIVVMLGGLVARRSARR